MLRRRVCEYRYIKGVSAEAACGAASVLSGGPPQASAVRSAARLPCPAGPPQATAHIYISIFLISIYVHVYYYYLEVQQCTP